MHRGDRFPYSGLQLGILLGAICVTFAIPFAVKAGESRSGIPVAVKLVGDDALTQALSSAVKSKVSSSKSLALSQDLTSDTFVISSDTNVNWDILLGKTVIIYHVQLTKAGHLTGDKVGVCFEKQADKCASDIVNQFGRIMAIRG
jgi:hypothetical protein